MKIVSYRKFNSICTKVSLLTVMMNLFLYLLSILILIRPFINFPHISHYMCEAAQKSVIVFVWLSPGIRCFGHRVRSSAQSGEQPPWKEAFVGFSVYIQPVQDVLCPTMSLLYLYQSLFASTSTFFVSVERSKFCTYALCIKEICFWKNISSTILLFYKEWTEIMNFFF